MKTTGLKIYRKSLGYTQEKIAELFDMKRSAYAMIELGYRSVPIDVIEKFSTFTGKTTDEIICTLKCHAVLNNEQSATKTA